MNTIYNWLCNRFNPAFFSFQQGQLRLMQKSGGKELQIGGVLARWLSRAAYTERSSILAQIKELRNEASRSGQKINRLDFGAGNRNLVKEGDFSKANETTLGQIVSRETKPDFWAKLLYLLVVEFKPETVIELGTNAGFSTATLAAGLKYNQKGTLISLEGDPSLAEIARKNLAELRLDRVEVITGLFSDTLPGALQKLKSLQFAYIDGHHDELATETYFEQILTHCEPGSIIIADDISWSDGMKRVWSKIKTHRQVAVSIDLKSIGVVITGKPGVKQNHYSFFLI